MPEISEEGDQVLKAKVANYCTWLLLQGFSSSSKPCPDLAGLQQE